MIRVVALPLFFIALTGLYFSITFGVADMYAKRSQDKLRGWNDQADLTLEMWQQAFDPLEKALHLSPNHPVYHQRIARLYRIKMANNFGGRDEQIETGQLALEHLRSSLNDRPSWGPAWAELALTKALVREFDDEYFQSLQNASQLGPWEPLVIRLVILLGRGDERRITENGLRTLVVDSYVRGLRSPVRSVFNNTLLALDAHLSLQAEVIDAVLPFIEASWPRGKSDNFFRLANWLWPHLIAEERILIFEQMFSNVSKYRNPGYWLGRSEDPGLSESLCQRFLEQGVSQDLSRWCER